jgi:thioredoxin 1
MRPAAAILLAVLAFAGAGRAQTNSVPLDTWKNVLLTGDAASLRSLYSVKPAPRLLIPGGQTTVDDDLAFWTGLKITTIDFETLLTGEQQPGLEQTIFTAKLTAASAQTLYVSVTQVWQRQPEGWRLVAAERTAATHLEEPTKEIYPPGADAHAEIKEALAQAAKEHKRVLLVFGASWCYDCHVLDLAFHREDLAPVVEKNYEVVHVDIGEGDKNQDLAKQYEVPMEKGVPAIAVLESDGKLLYSQKHGEFEKARALDPKAMLAFLNKWKPS